MPEAAVRRGYVDHAGIQLHYRVARPAESSAGPLILMLHPTPKSGWIFETTMQCLAGRGRTVVAPDTPGYGASDPLPSGHSIEAYALANRMLIETLVQRQEVPEGQVDVVGYHTGSVTAVEMANANDRAVRRLILFSLPFYDPQQRTAKLESLRNWPKPSADGNHLGRMWSIVENLCDKRVSTQWRHRSVVENLRAVDSKAGYEAVYRYDLDGALQRLCVPALIVNAGDDLFEQTRIGREAAGNCDYIELPDLAHGMFDLDAERLGNMIADFLSVSS